MNGFKHWFKHWFDIIILAIIEIIYLSAWFPHTDLYGKDLGVDAEYWNIIVPLSKDTFLASIVALSILLPSTFAILYYILQNEDRQKDYVKDAITSFSYASYAFILSIACAVIDMAYMPMKLKLNVNITLNWVILFFAITHFIAFFLGVVKFFRGSRYLFKH